MSSDSLSCVRMKKTCWQVVLSKSCFPRMVKIFTLSWREKPLRRPPVSCHMWNGRPLRDFSMTSFPALSRAASRASACSRRPSLASAQAHSPPASAGSTSASDGVGRGIWLTERTSSSPCHRTFLTLSRSWSMCPFSAEEHNASMSASGPPGRSRHSSQLSQSRLPPSVLLHTSRLSVFWLLAQAAAASAPELRGVRQQASKPLLKCRTDKIQGLLRFARCTTTTLEPCMRYRPRLGLGALLGRRTIGSCSSGTASRGPVGWRGNDGFAGEDGHRGEDEALCPDVPTPAVECSFPGAGALAPRLTVSLWFVTIPASARRVASSRKTRRR
mmetsp:Transcript_489/g.1479  ORF Transcript_489/g.1479 Transcript_489/m.1479 type:complete len:329 (+) Transcript_489:680-1666(+)